MVKCSLFLRITLTVLYPYPNAHCTHTHLTNSHFVASNIDKAHLRNKVKCKVYDNVCVVMCVCLCVRVPWC